MAYSGYISHHHDLDREHSKPIFSHDTLAHDDAPPYPTGEKKKGLAVQKILTL